MSDISTQKEYKLALEKFKNSSKENKEIALQIVKMLRETNPTTCNAKIVLDLCNTIINLQSTYSVESLLE